MASFKAEDEVKMQASWSFEILVNFVCLSFVLIKHGNLYTRRFGLPRAVILIAAIPVEPVECATASMHRRKVSMFFSHWSSLV